MAGFWVQLGCGDVGATGLLMDCPGGLIDLAVPTNCGLHTSCPLDVKHRSPASFSPAVDRALLLASQDLTSDAFSSVKTIFLYQSFSGLSMNLDRSAYVTSWLLMCGVTATCLSPTNLVAWVWRFSAGHPCSQEAPQTQPFFPTPIIMQVS